MSNDLRYLLSPRQAEIADLVKSGKTSREIGRLLCIDSRTVDSHVATIRGKLGVGSRIALAAALSARASLEASERSIAQPPGTNIPFAQTSLIGRGSQIEAIAASVRRSRLVTITGAGGVGKSRIALAAGTVLLDECSSGVWLVELASLTDGSLILQSIANVLGVEEAPNRTLLAALTAYLKQRAVLLVLDNCEHVVSQAAAAVDTLLRSCARVRILATSREPLAVAGEKVYRLPALTIPTPEDTVALRAEDVSRYASLALFVQRAQAVDNTFALGDAEAPLAGEICRRLDGIPVAIELAAARVDTFSLRTLVAKLDDRFRTLTARDRMALPQHRTVGALLDWSYSLLSERERALLGRVAIFPAGWTVEAAEAVCVGGLLDAASIHDVLSELVRKSQVVAERRGSTVRYRLLESLHAYSREKLDDCGERPAVAHRHALWVASFIAEASSALWIEPRRTWLAMIVPEIDNARAALAYALQTDTIGNLAGRIAAGLAHFLYYCGGAAEGRCSVESILASTTSRREPEVTAQLWLTLSTVRVGKPRAEAAESAISLFESLGDLRHLGVAYMSLAIAHRQMASFESSAAAASRSLELFRESGASRSMFYASTLGWRASALIGLDRFVEARDLFEEDIALYEALADEDRAAVERLNLAELEFASGDVRSALNLIETAIAALEKGLLETNARNEHSRVVPYLNAAAYRLILGQVVEARSAARVALDRSLRVGYPLYTAFALQHLATVAALEDNAQAAARLSGFVDHLLQALGTEREPTEKRTYDMLLRALQERLSITEIADLRARGAKLNEEGAIRLALAPEAV